MKPRGISAFSGPSFPLASVVGRAAQSGQAPFDEGDEDGLAHMHLDTLSISQAAHQSAQTSGQTSALAMSMSLTTEQAESEGEEEGEGSEDEGTANAAPTFLLADGTPGIFAIGDDGDGGGGDGGDSGDGD